ncbi:MAG: hypothetical protein V3U75_12035 [Methylococcaceae bacterium]
MNRSIIYVQYSDGSKPKGKKVTLGFSSGTTSPAYTDFEGKAVIEHASTGRATVYVNGSDKGTFNAPGTHSAFL